MGAGNILMLVWILLTLCNVGVYVHVRMTFARILPKLACIRPFLNSAKGGLNGAIRCTTINSRWRA